MKNAWVVFLLMFSHAAFADSCKTLNITGWTGDQRNQLIAEVNTVADGLDINHPFINVIGDYATAQFVQICVQGIFDLTPITETSILSQFSAHQAEMQIALAAAQARSQAIDSEKANNNICNAEPADLDSRIDTAVDAISNLADAKVFLKAFTKKLARCVWARTTVN